MAESSSVNLPAGFGGLTRFKEEYESRFNLKPELVIVFVIIIIIFRIGLGYFYG